MTEAAPSRPDDIASVIADRVLSKLAGDLGGADDLRRIIYVARELIANSALHGPRGKAMSIPEVAGRVGRDHQAVRRAIERGELTAYKVCGRLNVYESDFQAWHEACRIQPVTKRSQTAGEASRGRGAALPNGLRRLLESGANGA